MQHDQSGQCRALSSRSSLLSTLSAVEMLYDSVLYKCTIDNDIDIVLTTWTERKTHTRRKHCALAAVRGAKNFRPAADSLPGGAGRPKFKWLEMVTTVTYKPSLVKIDGRNFELTW